MSKTYWLTPEEFSKRKKRNKTLLYASLLLLTMIVSAAMTFLASSI